MNIMTKDKEKYICVHSLQIIRLVLSQVLADHGALISRKKPMC